MAQLKEPKYPDVHVQLTGESGNVFAIIGAVSRALKREVSRDAGVEFQAEAMNQESYDHVLALCMRWVDVA